LFRPTGLQSSLISPSIEFACLCDIRAVTLLIEFVVLLSPVDIIFDFRAAYLENPTLKYEQLDLLPFGQHPRLTAAVEQDWADQGLEKSWESKKLENF
jgi:hypothetical protein